MIVPDRQKKDTKPESTYTCSVKPQADAVFLLETRLPYNSKVKHEDRR